MEPPDTHKEHAGVAKLKKVSCTCLLQYMICFGREGTKAGIKTSSDSKKQKTGIARDGNNTTYYTRHNYNARFGHLEITIVCPLL